MLSNQCFYAIIRMIQALGYFPTITSDRDSTSPEPSFLFYDIVVIFQINGIKGEK